MPTDETKTVSAWKEQFIAQIQFREQKVIHSAYHASAKVIMGWADDTEVTEADYNAGIERSKNY